MDYPYSQEERLSRRQFFQLFCSKYLYECDKNETICDEPWTADIMQDILLTIYPDNILTAEDIQMMIYQSGMYPATRRQLYFGYHWENGVSKDIIAAVGPYITDAAYIKLNHTLRGAVTSSAIEFYDTCCSNSKIPRKKISLADAYDLYVRWCAANLKGAMTKKLFTKTMNKLGHRTLKGYVNGKCGINYFVLSVDAERVDQFAEPRRKAFQRKTEEIQQALEAAQTITGGGDESSETHAGEQAAPVFTIKENTTSAADTEGSHEKGGVYYEEDDEDTDTVNDNADDRSVLCAYDQPVAYATTNHTTSSDSSTTDRYNSTSTTGTTESNGCNATTVSTDVKKQVNHLPKTQKDAFKELKFDYRALSETPTFEDFEENCGDWGFKATPELFELFLNYLRR